MNQANEFQNGGNQDEHYEDEVDATRQDAEEKKTGWAIWKIFDKDSSKIPETKKEDITTNDDGLLQPADAEPAVDSAAKTGNKLTRHEKRSFFYFLKKKTKSKSLSDLNADTPVPVAEEPGDFEEIQFSSKEKSSEGAPLSNSEALYEPVGTKEEPAPVDSPTPVSDQVFLTQPEEEASRSDSAMAAAVSHRGQRSPDHVEGFDDFARFQSGLGQHPGKDEYNYDEEDDDDVNFEPQNGYEDDEDEDDEDQLEYDEDAVQVSAKKKERKPREPFRFPRVDMKTKLASMSEKVKKARMPSPHELRDGYLNSSFHKSFQQPLAVRTREMDDPEELEHRQELVKTRTPSQLAQINTLSDIPLPSTLKNLISPSEKSKKSEKKKSMEFDPDAQKAWGLYGTLPRSMRETKLMTNCREMLDEDQLKQRQDLVQTKSPVELSEIRGLSDFPVPTKLENIFKKSRSRSSSISKEKRTRSESLPRSLGATMYGTLPKSWRERNLVTQVKVEQDPEVLEKRRALTESKTPAELAQISSIADLPIPTALEKFLKSEKKQKTEVDSAPSESSVNLSRFRNLESMYDSLPRSLKTELLVSTKVIQDEDELKRRQLLVESKKPLELSQIQTLSDFPMPSAIENIFKTLESKKSDDTDDGQTTKRKRNLTTGAIFSYDALPESLKTDLLVRTKVEMDPETQKQRQELVQTKTPAELSQIRGLEDFPLPQRLDTLVRGSKRHLKSTKEKEGITKDAKSKSWSSLPSKSELYDALPESLKTEVLVRSRVETPEIQHERAETVKSKTVAELSQINSLSEFPVPKPLEKLLSSENISKMFDRPGSEAGSENKSFGENLYDTLPRSMKSQVLVRVRDEDPDIQRARQELVRSKSPTELSQISSLSDFPVPATIENLMKRKSPEPPKDSDEPVAPPRRFKKENLYESLPESLKTEVLVRTKVEVDEKVLKERQELCRSKSPAELSEIHDISEFPIPTFVENLGKKSFRKEKIKSTDGDTSQEVESGQEKRTFYDTLPASLKAECLVRSRVEDPEKQRARAETVRSKSVHELSRITSVSDIPIPATIENLMTRVPRPVERKKRFREKQRSLSAKNLQERMYDTLPKSLKSEVLVKSKFEDPEIIEQRKKVTQSKSVNELSQIHSLSDFPMPSTIEKLMFRAKSEPATEESSKCQTPRPVTPSHFAENIYASLPRSLKSEVLVRTRVESPEILRERQKVTQSKSVSELSQMKSISDFPIPTTIENLIHQARGLKEAKVEMSEESSHPPRSHSGDRGTHDIYASLPRSLKQEVMVRTKIEQDEELVRKRQALIESKTPVELSKINSFSEIPLPKRIEDWLHTSEQQTTGRTSSPMQARSFHELSSSMYETLPRSLKEPTLVRSKIEDPEIQKERCELTRTKTPSQLAEMHTLSDIPIPGLWERGRSPRRSSEKGERSISIPRNTQEIKEIVYTKVLPESLTKPCVVRCKVEDPQILIRRQQLQQSKSIHELSKIRNLNEFPLPGNLKLPDIPLPSAKKLLRVLARTPAPRKSTAPHTEIPQLVEISPSSTPRTQERTYTDDEMLRFDAGSPDDSSMAVREQDFGYEVIEQQQQELQLLQQLEVERVEEKFFDQSIPHDVTSAQQVLEEEESLAGQYRGTPPLRTKKKKQPGQHRHSHEVADPEEVPPPLPPKRPSKEADDHAFLSGQTNQSLMESNIEPREISEDNLGSNEMLLYVGVEPNDEASQPPVASFRKKRPSPVGGPFQAHEEIEERPGSNQGIQSRPLPPPPAPTRSLKRGLKKRSPSPPVGAHLLVHSSSHSTTEQFHSVASTLDRTLVDSSVERRRATARRSSDDDTLADSIVDSMHSCADTLVGNGDDDATLHSCADTLHDSEDEEFFSEQFDLSGRHFRGADLPHDDDDTPTISTGAGDELSSRLRTETHELGRELLEHVENLRQTLDKMSHRLGKSPEPQGQ